MGSENPTSADNQQETAGSTIVLESKLKSGSRSIDEVVAGSSETACGAHDPRSPEAIADRGKVQSDPHGDMGS